jgi:NAD(P)-dependent dehydrogenase (short-subunit alcohol dehydrogenase family)
MRIIVVGATGTIGSEVVRALSRKNHEVLPASRSSDLKVDLDNPASLRVMFEKAGPVDAVVSCAGNAAFKRFAELTDDDYELGLRSKLMGQVLIARLAKDRLRDGGSITLTTGILASARCREARPYRWSTRGSKASCVPRRSKCREGFGSMRSARPG